MANTMTTMVNVQVIKKSSVQQLTASILLSHATTVIGQPRKILLVELFMLDLTKALGILVQKVAVLLCD
jgi:hypothetical protein